MTEPVTDQVILVDEQDREIGAADKVSAHAGKGLLHRAFSVFLFDDQGRVLLQKRSSQKPLWPGYWANSCCSHPRPGETVEDAAARRVREELGIECRPSFLFKFAYHAQFGDTGSEHELCYVLTAKTTGHIEPDPAEIADTRWLSPDALTAALDTEPEGYSPWLRLEWPRVREACGEGNPTGIG